MFCKCILIILGVIIINFHGFANGPTQLSFLSEDETPVSNVHLTIDKNKAIEEKKDSLSTYVLDTLLLNSEHFVEKDEFVEIGYGQIKKTNLTGAVSSLNNEDITQNSLNNPMEVLQGSMAGVNVQSSTGRLGDPYWINIRGTNILINDAAEVNGGTIGGKSQPLYIVDGVYTEDIDFLNPYDIARIDVLKDAASTSVYGFSGSNGVIIVTTQSGAEAKPGVNVSFDSYYGIKKAKELPDFMDGQTWWDFNQIAYTDDNIAGMSRGRLDTMAFNISNTYPAPYGQNRFLIQNATTNNTTDWADLILQDGMMDNNYLSITGAGDKVSYNIGAGIQNETGLIQKEALDKYSLKGGLNVKVIKFITVGTNITFSKSDLEQGSDSAMEDAFRFPTLMSPYDIDGETLFIQPGKLVDEDGRYIVNKTSTWNPLLKIPNASDLTNRTNLITSSYLRLSFTDWLQFKLTFSTGNDSRDRNQFLGGGTQAAFGNQVDGEPMPISAQTKISSSSYTYDNQINFNYTSDDNLHYFRALALHSFYSRIGTIRDDESNLHSNTQQLASFAFRLNYAFKDKYLVSLSTRIESSAVFVSDKKWATFPSAALAWKLSKETFMQNVGVVSNLKLRLSAGITGNNSLDPYSSMINLNNADYYTSGDGSSTDWLPGFYASQNLTWKKTREFNFGLDYGFLKNRINGGVDFYDRLSDGALKRAEVGEVRNKGVELSLNTVNVMTQKLVWVTSFLFSKNINQIISIYGQTEKDDIGNNLFIGESVNTIYNYEFAGIVQANQVNNPMFVEANLKEGMAYVNDISGPDGIPDGKLDEDDRTVLGSSDPKWTGTLNSRLTVFNFDFSFSILTYQGVLVNSPFYRNFIDLNDRDRQKLDVPYYVPANNLGFESNFSNEYPRPRKEGQFWKNGGIGNIKDASYTKIKQISLGYTIPESLLSKVRIKYFRIYISIIDPFVFAKYEGYDPEWATASLSTGRVGYTTYQVGLNLRL